MNENLYVENILETRVCLSPEELTSEYQELLFCKVKKVDHFQHKIIQGQN